MKNETFNDLYKKLNKRQKEAVDAIYGPVMVIAGPGTGKTQILSLRIANILTLTDTAPESILALTFTESGVFSMRKRLVDIIGSAAYKVRIHTFHGFCNTVIKEFPDEFDRIIGSANISDIEQIRILEKIISDGDFKLLKPFGDPTYYVRPTLGIIRQLKRENVSPKDFSKIVEDQQKDFKSKESDMYHLKGAHKGKMKGEYVDLKRKIEKNEELADIYAEYEKVLGERRLYDYEDMILETIRVLEKNSDLLLRLQETHQFILADEHQDANAAQNRILELLSNFDESPNLFIVGDEKQAIFRFQGASLDNFLHFKKIYPKAKVIDLEENYRSSQIILDAAHSLIENNKVDDASLRTKLKSAGKEKTLGPSIYLREFSTERLEAMYIAEDIKKRISEGTKPSDIAVIYRENKDAFSLITHFDNKEIPYVVRSDQNILSDSDIRRLLLLFRTILSPGQDDFVGQLMYVNFLELDPLDVFTISNEAEKSRKPISYVILQKEIIEKLPLRDKEKMLSFGENLIRWSKLARNRRVSDMFGILIKEAGFLDYLMKENASTATFAKIDALFREAEKLLETNRDATVADFIAYIDTLDQYNVLIRSDAGGTLVETVEMMTAHKSKGREFEIVYIVGVRDGHWGNKRDIRHFHIPIKGLSGIGVDSTEDERRLFYVALTRAKKEICISYALHDDSGKDFIPSQFIGEIQADLVVKESVEEIEKELSKEPTFASAGSVDKSGSGILDKEFIQSKFLEQGFSVTALNNYIDCPWNYFFSNLIRIPKLRTHHQMYGIAMHEALKNFFNQFKTEKVPTKEYLLKTFERSIKRQPLSTHHLDLSLARGKESLDGYYEKYHAAWNTQAVLEYTVAGVFIDLPDPEQKIMIRGVLDKVEILDDNGRVNVVDYKTRQPLSRNEIIGNTKNSNGNYFRQLVFYKLLLDGQEESKFCMESGEIDFIEPNQKGEYKKERFEITKQDEETLIESIQTAAREILDLSFFDKTCTKKDCEYCEMKDLLFG